MKKPKADARTIKISYSNVVDALASFLIATGVVNDDEHITNIDIPMDVDDKVLVSIRIHVSKTDSQ